MDFLEFFSGFSPQLATFILGMLPFTELRGAIPVAILVYHLPPAVAFIWSVLGNLVPAYLILIFIGPFSDFLRRHSKVAEKFLNWWFRRVYQKFFEKYNKYGEIALAVFVAVPFPLTGAWAGATAAWLFKISKQRALPFITVGVLLAGLIVTVLTVGTLRLI